MSGKVNRRIMRSETVLGLCGKVLGAEGGCSGAFCEKTTETAPVSHRASSDS